MKELSNEIKAYALKNALEFQTASPDKILPKLFQHGLDKQNIKKVLPTINEIVQEINSLEREQKEELFLDYEQYIIKTEKEKEREFPELPSHSKKTIFRVAPFPSGALHLGHAKTFLENAFYAKKYKGKLLLVMDDTIGSKEKQLTEESYDLIKEAFDWLGVKYDKIIYKSDRLEIYYDYAEKLIKKGKAYVCHCSQKELHNNREIGRECGCRQFPINIQLLRWEEMFKAKEGDAILRIKTNMQHPDPAFRDRVLFKITDRAHPRTRKKYRVWPTLEMNWAIDDHLLKITHIIRGADLQIETQMEKYIWDIFKWKHPITIHTGLIHIEGAKISKSKAQKEVQSGKFSGWSDPRTWSIQSLRRRGIKPEAIWEFIKEIGMNTQNISVPIESLYSINRKIIDSTANRYSFIENPIELTIQDKPEIKEVLIPVHPDKTTKRKTKINKIFISKKDYDKLKGQEIRLLHLFNIKLKNNNKAKFTSKEVKQIPKINWVSDFVQAKILLPDGKFINGIADSEIKTLKKDEILQFERFAFVKYEKAENNVHEFWLTHK